MPAKRVKRLSKRAELNAVERLLQWFSLKLKKSSPPPRRPAAG